MIEFEHQYFENPYVCKFRKIDERLLSLLNKYQIYIPKVKELNDPLEGILTEGYGFSEKTLPRQVIIDYLENVGVYSVSRHKQKSHLSNFLPMWALYADNYQGVCLVFKRKAIMDPRFKWLDIEYVPHRDNHTEDRPFTVSPPIFNENCFENAQKKLAKKFNYWDHEREARLITTPECTGFQSIDDFFELHALVFGFNTSQKDFNAVLESLPNNALKNLMESEKNGIFQVEHPSMPRVYTLVDLRKAKYCECCNHKNRLILTQYQIV